jgi:hypothetical protein
MQGGSLGKGTAIREKCDLDLVLFLNNYQTVSKFRQQLPDITRLLESAIRNHRKWKDNGFDVAVIANKGRLICITMNYYSSEEGRTYRLRVDVVPAFRLAGKYYDGYCLRSTVAMTIS